MEEISFSHLVVARVLPQQSGEYGARPEVSDDGVGIRSPEAFGIAHKPLAIGGVCVVGLADACFDAHEDDFDGVKAPLRHCLELLPGGKRR